MPSLRDLTLADALTVVADMRPEDAACIRAVSGQEPGEWFAVDRWQTSGPAWTLLQDGQPWAIAGVSMPNRWTGVMWFVSRPGLTGESWRKVIRQTRTVLRNVPTLGIHRTEAMVLDGWEGASALVRRLGFVRESTRRRAGSSGENVQVWVHSGQEGKT